MKIDLKIKKEALRYLGYRGEKIDDITDTLLDESIKEIGSLIDSRYDYKFFDLYRDGSVLGLEKSNFELSGANIKDHLRDSDSSLLLAVTLGHEVDRKIRYYEKISMEKALILDAAASAAIEEIADKICKKIDKELRKEGKTLTSRYSPGYGDFPIDIQARFLSLIGAESSIGLTSTYSSILIPRKSITAIMGIIDIEDEKTKGKSCSTCTSYPGCIYSKEDKGCES